MANTCLVTKLKGVVSGDAPIYGCLEIVIAGTGTPFKQNFSVLSNEESIVSGNNGIVFKNLSLSKEYSNPFTLTSIIERFNVICAADAKMAVTNKYKLRAVEDAGYYVFRLAGVKEFVGGIDSFIYSIPANANYVGLPNYSSNMKLSDIVPKVVSYNSSIVAFEFSNSPLIEGNINVFRNINNLKRIDVGNCPLVNGTIAELKSITTLDNIACANTQVGGTIEEFVAGQRAAGRTTGTVSGNSAGWGLVTFDGATTHAKGAVSWTATTITMDGVTINT